MRVGWNRNILIIIDDQRSAPVRSADKHVEILLIYIAIKLDWNSISSLLYYICDVEPQRVTSKCFPLAQCISSKYTKTNWKLRGWSQFRLAVPWQPPITVRFSLLRAYCAVNSISNNVDSYATNSEYRKLRYELYKECIRIHQLWCCYSFSGRKKNINWRQFRSTCVAYLRSSLSLFLFWAAMSRQSSDQSTSIALH